MYLEDKLALVGIKKGYNRYESWFIDDLCDLKGWSFDFVMLMENITEEEMQTVKAQVVEKKGIILC